MSGDEKIKIIPKTKLLTPEELIALRNVEYVPIKSGLKRTTPSGSEEEKAELKKFQDALRNQLSVQRIERVCVRNIGHWDPEENAVKIVRQEGKFETFGYSKNSNLYLEYYEALFLLELNRLEIYRNNTLLSIEEAYLLLLNEEQGATLDNYLVYSNLSRAGYIVQKYNPTFEHPPPSEEDCIWETLFKCLDADHRLPAGFQTSLRYVEMQKAFEAVKIIIQTGGDNVNKCNDDEMSAIFQGKVQCSQKRKASTTWDLTADTPTKKPRFSSNQNSTGSYLNFLKDEEEYKKFKNIFKSFDIIGLYRDDDSSDEDELKIQFDLYLPNEGFKKSEPSEPPMRVIVVTADEHFPTRSKISRCYQKQKVAVPILLVSVSESKQIHAFLYHFT